VLGVTRKRNKRADAAGPRRASSLYGFQPTDSAEEPDLRSLSAKTSRQLRLLRAHGVIKRVPKTHRYRLTADGQVLTAALFATRRANIKALLANAA
jgi:hypothetical protein